MVEVKRRLKLWADGVADQTSGCVRHIWRESVQVWRGCGGGATGVRLKPDSFRSEAVRFHAGYEPVLAGVRQRSVGGVYRSHHDGRCLTRSSIRALPKAVVVLITRLSYVVSITA